MVRYPGSEKKRKVNITSDRLQKMISRRLLTAWMVAAKACGVVALGTLLVLSTPEGIRAAIEKGVIEPKIL